MSIIVAEVRAVKLACDQCMWTSGLLSAAYDAVRAARHECVTSDAPCPGYCGRPVGEGARPIGFSGGSLQMVCAACADLEDHYAL